MSRVDVIVPCYNYARFLPDCLMSILSQNVDLRILVLDDASTDETAEVAAEWAARDGRVEWRRHSANCGHIATYNEGLQWCSGEYNLLISADDLLTVGALDRAVRFLNAHPEVGFVYGCALTFQSGEPLPDCKTGGEHEEEVLGGHQWVEQVCRSGANPIRSPEIITRTALQRVVGGYRADLPHTADMEMWLRFAAHADVGVLNADQAYYRVHGGNMHLTQYGKAFNDLRHKHLAYLAAFDAYGARFPNVEHLRALAASTLAEKALWAARAEYDGPGSRVLLARLALKIDPSIGFRPAYWRLWKSRLASLIRRGGRAISRLLD